jgi:hypothetical protein
MASVYSVAVLPFRFLTDILFHEDVRYRLYRELYS